jgi:hypothetical protein
MWGSMLKHSIPYDMTVHNSFSIDAYHFKAQTAKLLTVIVISA